MKIGMVLPIQEGSDDCLRPPNIMDAARRIESAGFDGIWVFDSVNRGFFGPDPLIALAAAAAATEHVELGTGILQLSIRDPVELAHRVMTLHLISGDRLCLGVGAGSTPSDFHAFSRSFDDRFTRFESTLLCMRSLMRGETVDGVQLSPWKSTLGGPSILIGSWARRPWIERAARDFDGWIASETRGGDLAAGIRIFRAAGGKRAVVTNVQIDGAGLGQVKALSSAHDRLHALEQLGFDTVVVRTLDHSIRNLEAIREIAP